MERPDNGLPIDNGQDLRKLFPGYYPPTTPQRQNAFTDGLITFDANALLSLYRFTQAARDELLTVMTSVKDRLFVTHQAAYEFQNRRLDVVDTRLTATIEENQNIEKHLKQADERIRAFSKRHQVDAHRRDELLEAIDELRRRISGTLLAMDDDYNLSRDEVKSATDPVIRSLDELLNGRVGESYTEDQLRDVIKEAQRRKSLRIPPGFSDANKGDERRQAGDYIIWRQVLDQAKLSERPVLLVGDDSKEDWVRYGAKNESLGPRPELVLELQTEAGVQLHTASVLGFLIDARTFLGSDISTATLREAESLPPLLRVSIELTPGALKMFGDLQSKDQVALHQAIDELATFIAKGYQIGLHPQVSIVKSKSDDLFLFRWSRSGRLVFDVTEAGKNQAVILIHRINFKREHDGGIPADEE